MSKRPDPPRHRTPTAHVERALLDAATQLLEDEGPEALSVRRICTAANVAPMGLYSRFGGKQGVVEALFVEGFEELRELFTTIDLTDAGAALRESGYRYRQHALANRARYSIMFDRPIIDFDPSDDAKLRAGAAFEALISLVRRAIERGAIAPRDPDDVAQLIWSTCHGAVSLELAGLGFVEDRNELYEQLLDLLMRGLTT
ncbi:MAG: TetR/AcrR family transcriptional regulator [Ilumatobacteraceae bacterium]|jgi:AcrR family transcriptional regulator